ncbi:retrovirus-related pol polyprotein from transposon TNT 1-94 [Tanacetum coccineum]|uniref:Retrovirus-related pol polyprotein from transposon TNT 1-94 n=1 Tax=Tanacetum coccineum TaxID=301880 RepID=A0ABQ4WZN6_9ASTR
MGKENGVNILKSIDEGPFLMPIFRETLAEGTEGALGHMGQCEDALEGRQNRGQGKNARGAGTAGYGGALNRVGNANPDKMLLMQAQENGVALDEIQLLFLTGRQDNIVDEDVDEQPVQDAHTILKARCLELEVEIFDLRDKIQKDNHDELLKWFSNLEVNHLNLQLKCQNLKESFGNNTSPPTRDVPDFDSVFVIEKMKASIQGKDNAIKKLRMQISQLNETYSEADRTPLNTRDNKHASTSLPKKNQVTFEEQCAMSKSNTHKPVEQLSCQKTNVLVPPSTEVNSCTDASRSQHRSNTKKNRILSAKSVNMKKVEEHPRTIKSSPKTTNHVNSSISSKRTIINSNSHSVCQTCNKCLISANHDMCVVTYLNSVNATPSVKNIVRNVKQVWKPKKVKQGATDRPVVFGTQDLFKNIRLEIAQGSRISVKSSSVRFIDFRDMTTLVLIMVEYTLWKEHPYDSIDNDHFINVFAPEPRSEASSSGDLSSTESPYVSQTLHHLRKWSKDHRLDNIIGNPSRLVSTRKQLATDALWCLYNSVLSKVKPKNFKSAITEDCWFQAMQDEIHEFDRLQVWELVPPPDCVMIISLKWIYKVKLDEYSDVLKNKARLVAKGYRQEEGIDFEGILYIEIARIEAYSFLHRLYGPARVKI